MTPLDDPDAQAAGMGKAYADTPSPPIATEVTLAVTGLSANAAGFASAFARIGDLPAPTARDVVFAFLREPLVLTGAATLVGAITTALWRRKHT